MRWSGKPWLPAMAAAVLTATSSVFVQAQTWTDCNPLQKTCPANPALATTAAIDFTKGEDKSFFKVLNGGSLPVDGARGAVFSITKPNESPTVGSHKYIFFGKVEVVMQAAPGAGIITSVVLQSDDLDEIDWEWIGSDPDIVQTNYFSRGDTTTYNRGGRHAVTGTTSSFYTYTLEWTRDAITWSVNGAPVRVLTYADADNGKTYPQSPMQVKLGTWVAGKEGNAPGTIAWAGGLADFSKAPFVAYYKSITVTDYSNGVQGAKQYIYGDRSGTYQSIIVDTTGTGKSGDDGKQQDTTTQPATMQPAPPSTKAQQSATTGPAQQPSTLSMTRVSAVSTRTSAAPSTSAQAHESGRGSKSVSATGIATGTARAAGTSRPILAVQPGAAPRAITSSRSILGTFAVAASVLAAGLFA